MILGQLLLELVQLVNLYPRRYVGTNNVLLVYNITYVIVRCSKKKDIRLYVWDTTSFGYISTITTKMKDNNNKDKISLYLYEATD